MIILQDEDGREVVVWQMPELCAEFLRGDNAKPQDGWSQGLTKKIKQVSIYESNYVNATSEDARAEG